MFWVPTGVVRLRRCFDSKFMRLGPPHNTRELHGSNLSSQLLLPYLGYEHTQKPAPPHASLTQPKSLRLFSLFLDPN